MKTIAVSKAECETCGKKRGEHHVAIEQEPSSEQLMEWESDGGCQATDGCWVEPDGVCEHGHESWMLMLGVV